MSPPISVEAWGGVQDHGGGDISDDEPETPLASDSPVLENFSDDSDDEDIIEIDQPADDDIVELTQTQDPSQLVVSMQQVDEVNWGPFYLQCPTYGNFWVDAHDSSNILPEKVKVFKNRVYQEEN